jgi:small subunit ribosomal protein S1
MNEFNNLLEADLAGRSLTVGQVVEGTVVQISEDGIFIDIGAKSEGQLQLDQIFQEELAKLQVGDTVKVRIIKKADGVFQLSKKSVDYEEAWNKLIADRDEGKEVEITVREKVKNGYMATAYELLEGFVHHTNFHGKPTIGKTYNAQILDLNRKARKLVFTRREILKREEAEALERDYSMLQEGMVIEGEVEKLSPYGAFVKITDHLTGLLHISEFSYEHVRKPSEVLKPGEVVQVKILSIDREKNKISLSRKATIKDPLMTMLPGEEIDGVVESVVDFGIFVKLDMGVTGLVHISELSFRKFSHPSELYKPGDALRVKVLRVQLEDRRVSLSAKACERDPWEDVYSRYMVDQPVSGKVVQLLQSGAIIKLDEFFEAFLPISEISEERIKHPGDELEEGQEIEGIILSIDSSKRRIRVSIRRTKAQPEGRSESRQVQVQDVGSREDVTPTAGKVTLGDILGSKLDLTGVEREKEESAAAAESAVEESAQPEAGTEEAAAETGQPEPETGEVEKPAPIATPEEPAGESSAPEPAAEDDAQETATPDAETEEPAAATDAAGEVGSAEPAEEDEDKPADAGGATGE